MAAVVTGGRCVGALTRKGSRDTLSDMGGELRRRKSLQLEHAPPIPDEDCRVVGPFDVVVTDILQSSVLNALIQVTPSQLAGPKVGRAAD